MREAGIALLVASELRADRAAVLAHNFPQTTVITGDIAKTLPQLIAATRDRLAGRPLDVLLATPPCQGMSKNGRGKLLRAIRTGQRPALDPRNQLILHALSFARALRPRLILFENVPEMERTLIEDRAGALRGVLDVITAELGPDYSGTWEVVEFADYGIPQRRQRLITVFSRDHHIRHAIGDGRSLMPPRTHAATPTPARKPWVTVSEALRDVPALDASSAERARGRIPYHHVPILQPDKYFWVSSTPPGRGAFDNQCVSPGCGFQGTPGHGALRNAQGVNRAKTDTPLRCARCGALLPRPWVVEDGKHRIMRGFTSAYKRMRGDLPASALTKNLSYACSDHKLHPTENRVLSLHEAFILHTIADYAFAWRRGDGKRLSDKTVREIIGESIPPRGLCRIIAHLLDIMHPADADAPAAGLRLLRGDAQDAATCGVGHIQRAVRVEGHAHQRLFPEPGVQPVQQLPVQRVAIDDARGVV